MASPTTGILDNFTRANENPLGNGNWSGPLFVGDGQLQILTNLASNNGTGNSTSYWSAANFGPDCEAYGTISGASSNEDWIIGVRFINPNTGSVSGYELLYRGSTSQLIIRRVDNSGYFIINTVGSISLSDGDQIWLNAVGTTLTSYTKIGAGAWTQQGQVTDSTYVATGRLILGLGDTGTNNEKWSSFGGGTIVSAGSTSNAKIVKTWKQ